MPVEVSASTSVATRRCCVSWWMLIAWFLQTFWHLLI
jgi:hypothetical protein